MRHLLLIPLAGATSWTLDLPETDWLPYLANRIAYGPPLIVDLRESLNLATTVAGKTAVGFLAAELVAQKKITSDTVQDIGDTVCHAVVEYVYQIPNPFSQIDSSREMFDSDTKHMGKLFARTFLANMHLICEDMEIRERLSALAHAIARYIGSSPPEISWRLNRFKGWQATGESKLEFLEEVPGVYLQLGYQGMHDLDLLRIVNRMLTDRYLFQCDEESVCRPTRRDDEFEGSLAEDLRNTYTAFGKALGMMVLQRQVLPKGMRLSHNALYLMTHATGALATMSDLKLENRAEYERLVALLEDSSTSTVSPDDMSTTTTDDYVLASFIKAMWHGRLLALRYIAIGFQLVLPYNEIGLARLIDPVTLGQILTESSEFVTVEELEKCAVYESEYKEKVDWVFGSLKNGPPGSPNKFVERVTGLKFEDGDIPLGGLIMLPKKIFMWSSGSSWHEPEVAQSIDYYEIGLPMEDHDLLMTWLHEK